MVWWWSLAQASTCTPPVLHELSIDPGIDDSSPPVAGALESVTVQRGESPSVGPEEDECAGLGTITITIGGGSGSSSGSSATGTSTDAVGYLLRMTKGDLPDGMEALPAAAISGPEVEFTWDDGAIDDQDAFFFQVELTAVDAAGNLGGTLLVPVADDGIAAAACDTAPASSLGILGLLAPIFGLRRIRPRARG